MGRANHVVQFYGIHSLLADLDSGREFWREGDTIVHSVLDWIVTEGFQEFMAQYEFEYQSPKEWRERHFIALLKKLG